MADHFETGYQPLASYPDDDQDGPPTQNIVHVPDNGRARWNHIEDLDEFFTRVYQYHQRSGFLHMILQDIFQLLQFLFVVLFSAFLISCIDYPMLFGDRHINGTKVTIGDVVDMQKCTSHINPWLLIALLVAFVFWGFRLIKFIYMLFKYMEIRAFYLHALKLTVDDLGNMTWHEVQRRLLEVQKEQQMCIHKQELTELDIYHRILRFKNYMVAMFNKSLLPLTYKVPGVGDCVFLTTGLKYNLEMLLFWGPWSPFENNWHLKSDYRNYHKRKDLGAMLGQRILLVGVANLLLSPLIFLWQILYSFFRYAEIVKREPNLFGSRQWSLYARLYLRHLNELDHEFDCRLKRGYKPADKYMLIFTSPIVVLVSKHVAFLVGSVLAVLVILTVVDEDVLAVQNVIGTMTILGLILTVCRSLIPSDTMVFCPDFLMRKVLEQIHYIPDSWKGRAHTYKVRDEFSLLFQYKIVYLLEELFSPIITPLVLIHLRHKALDIVDFYRNFTVEVTGVGDVCSFAQMDIRKHGNPQWVLDEETEATQYQQAEDGKTELSLMHFYLTNPEWKPPDTESQFIFNLKEQAHRDAATVSVMPADNPLYMSLNSLSAGGYQTEYNSMMGSVLPPSAPSMPWAGRSQMADSSTQPQSLSGMTSSGSQHSGGSSVAMGTSILRGGGLRLREGPLGGSTNGILSSLQHGVRSPTGEPEHDGPVSLMPMDTSGNILAPGAASSMQSLPGGYPSLPPLPTVRFEEDTLELLSAEMSFSALYMHELHHRRRAQPYFEPYIPSESDEGGSDSPSHGWGPGGGRPAPRPTPPAPWGPAGAQGGASAPATQDVKPKVGLRMPNIQETSDEEINNDGQPLVNLAAGSMTSPSHPSS